MSGRPPGAVRRSPETEPIASSAPIAPSAPIAAGFSSDRHRLYVVAAWVPRRETIVVGSLGAIAFPRGWYAYVGSARRGRDARVARHRRSGKPLCWHADYLFSRYPAGRAWLIDTRQSECELAASLGGEVVPRFGSSDCGCSGHLVRLPRLACLRGALTAAAGDGLTPERRQ